MECVAAMDEPDPSWDISYSFRAPRFPRLRKAPLGCTNHLTCQDSTPVMVDDREHSRLAHEVTGSSMFPYLHAFVPP